METILVERWCLGPTSSNCELHLPDSGLWIWVHHRSGVHRPEELTLSVREGCPKLGRIEEHEAVKQVRAILLAYSPTGQDKRYCYNTRLFLKVQRSVKSAQNICRRPNSFQQPLSHALLLCPLFPATAYWCTGLQKTVLSCSSSGPCPAPAFTWQLMVKACPPTCVCRCLEDQAQWLRWETIDPRATKLRQFQLALSFLMHLLLTQISLWFFFLIFSQHPLWLFSKTMKHWIPARVK